MIRKWISIFLLLAIFVSMVPAQALSAGSAEKVYTDILINPEYADMISAEDIPKSDPTEYGTLDFGVGGYMSVDEAALVVREAMKRRETSISVNFYVGENDPYQGYFAAFHCAMAHTGNPTEGDYLAKQYSSCSVSYSYSGGIVDDEPVTKYGATYTVTYFTDAAQEAEMDAAVADLLQKLNVWSEDDYTKFKAVYDYICTNITYDYDNLNDSTYHLKHSAYAALIHKTAVCQGYALLLYRLMLELGVDCRYISGMAYNGVDTGSHGWNIVKLDGKYYNADSTWDAGGYGYMWCLQSQETFKWHYRDEEYDTPEFHSTYPMAATDYVYAGDCTHDYAVVITLPTCTDHGYTTYTCRNCSSSYVDSYTDPSHNYVDGVCTVCADVQIVVNGICGDNLFWTLNAVGTLSITGTGPMQDYYVGTAPWYSIRSSIKTVVLENGVTTIGAYAFYDCDSLADVYYSGTAEQWAQVTIKDYNDPLLTANIYVVITVIYGDATGDGVIDGLDVIRLKKYLANYNYDTGTSTVEISAGADATGDGVIDGLDVIRLKKYLANYNYDTGTSTIPLGPQ